MISGMIEMTAYHLIAAPAFLRARPALSRVIRPDPPARDLPW
jgi:hypothetical protein